MKIAAIISEYNPFHNGHKYQIDQARGKTGCDAVVALMSGNYVQRGDIAVFPKEVRAKAALACGIDLVLENSPISVLRSAEGYADAAVYTLNALGCIDYLVFGAEHSNLDDLYDIARFLVCEGEDFKRILCDEMSRGGSFAAARGAAVSKLLGTEAGEILKKPNNLLAIEYLKAIIRQKSDIEPILIQRVNAEHDSTTANDGFASASYVRSEILNGADYVKEFVPNNAWDIYSGLKGTSILDIEKGIVVALCLKSAEEIAKAPDISEGLENKIKKTIMECNGIEDLLNSVKSKRYAYSRLQRAVLCAYLGITKADAKRLPEYIKVLDFNDVGQGVLNIAKKSAIIPIAKNASRILKNEEAMSVWRRELEFDKVYEIFYN